MSALIEPKYLAQNGEPLSRQAQREWLDARASEARAMGSTFFRVTHHPDIADLILIEGWKEFPGDQGEPRFQFEAVA